MRVSMGLIALARPGWEMKQGSITSVVGNGSGGRPDVFCAQMLLAAAVSGIRTLVLLPGLRTDEPVWQSVGQIIGGGDAQAAAREMRLLPVRMYASGTGREYAGKAELVYAPGLRPDVLEQMTKDIEAPVLTLTDLDDTVGLKKSAEVIRVSGDTVTLDNEGFEFPVVYDPSGPVYRPA